MNNCPELLVDASKRFRLLSIHLNNIKVKEWLEKLVGLISSSYDFRNETSGTQSKAQLAKVRFLK